MKKILATVFATLFAITTSTANADVSGLAFGVTLSNNDLATTVKDDIDSNGTTTTTKNLTDTVTAASVFAEYTMVGSTGMGMTVGFDWIPVEADLDKRSAAQASIKGNTTSSVSGTNSGKATIEDHVTLYVQPGFVTGNTMIYGSLGYIQADITATWESISSTNTTDLQTLNGTSVGAGVKHVFGGGLVVKLQYLENDYDQVSYKTSNNTTVTGDIDNEQTSLSVGYTF